MAWQRTHTHFPLFFWPCLWSTENPQDSPKIWRESPLYLKWGWPQALPFGEVINKILAPLMTTVKSDLETRNWQQRKTINILNRKAKTEKTKPNQTTWLLSHLRANSSASWFTLFSHMASWGFCTCWDAPLSLVTVTPLIASLPLGHCQNCHLLSKPWPLPACLPHNISSLRTEINVGFFIALAPDFFRGKVVNYNIIGHLYHNKKIQKSNKFTNQNFSKISIKNYRYPNTINI